MLKQLAPGPVVVLQVLGGRLDRVAFHVLDRFIDAVLGKINRRRRGKMRHAGFRAGVAQVLGVLGPGQFVRGANNHVEAHEHLDVIRVASGFGGAGAYLVDLDFGRRLVLPADEHTLGMSPGKQQATV